VIELPVPTRSHRVLAAIAAIGAGVQLAILILFARLLVGELQMNDFGKFYYSTIAFLRGADMYDPTIATAVPVGPGATHQFWNLNPPHFHLLVLPLAWLAPMQALSVWFAAGLFCLCLCVFLIWRELSIPWTPQSAFVATVAVLLPSSTGMVVLTGQVTLILMLPITLAWVSARRGAWTAAGVYLGLAASVKPFLGIFWIYLLLKRRLRAAGVMAAVAIAWAGIGATIFGVASYQSWMATLSKVDWVWGPMNGSVAALFVRIFGPNPTFRPLIDNPEAGWVAAVTVSAGIAACTCWVLGRDDSDRGADRAFAGLILAALLITPLGWMYYLALLAGPAAALWLGGTIRATRPQLVCIAVAVPGLLLPHIVTGVWQHFPGAGSTLGSVYTWALIALWTAVMLDASHRTPSAIWSDRAGARDEFVRAETRR
jgi:alpha-1,2-mannosyltransferase